MNQFIQLSESNCRSCMRCVKVCPTKAMTYVNYQPQIIEEECILCGQCYMVCPHSAKKVTSDLNLVKSWIAEGKQVIASVAPSFASIWTNYNKFEQRMLNFGFSKVEEAARGAKIVSEAYMELMQEGKMKNIIATSCPAVVSLVEKEFPDLVDQLAPVVSPMIAHGKDIKKRYPDAKVVFITPCIAKQKEIKDPRFAGVIDATISMPDLFEILTGTLKEEADLSRDWPEFEGKIARLYPTPGGVGKTIASTRYHILDVEGIDRVSRTLHAIQSGQLEGYFFEMSSCAESCLGGPLIKNFQHNEWLAHSMINTNVEGAEKVKACPIEDDLKATWKSDHIVRQKYSESQIRDMLWIMGKTSKNKELNCGSCGYETCVDKAIAVLDGKADPKLCLPMALEHAESISNLIIENTPNGIIVLNTDYKIQQINPSAVFMLSLENVNARGMNILDFLPSIELEENLKRDEKVQYFRKEYPEYNLILSHALIRLDSLYILILMDITVEETKELVIKKMQQQTVDVAQKVIDDQMRAVQEIASLLGETTAKSKIALTKLMKAIDENE